MAVYNSSQTSKC